MPQAIFAYHLGMDAEQYVAGTMEEDGFAYDGAAVYDAETRQCLRVYGDYPDEKAQEQAAAFALEHDAVTPNGTELPAFLDMHLIEANLLDDGGRKHKRQEIFEYFQAHKNLAERTEFLKNSYNDITTGRDGRRLRPFKSAFPNMRSSTTHPAVERTTTTSSSL